jgi:hypothetical protein
MMTWPSGHTSLRPRLLPRLPRPPPPPPAQEHVSGQGSAGSRCRPLKTKAPQTPFFELVAPSPPPAQEHESGQCVMTGFRASELCSVLAMQALVLPSVECTHWLTNPCNLYNQ